MKEARLPLSRHLTRFVRPTLCRLALRFPRLVHCLPTPRPFAMRCHAYPGPSAIRDLIVMLPGISDMAEDFERHGFIGAVREAGWPADIVVVDAHYGYYADRTVLQQLHEDVFGPAKAQGYRRVWMAGISLGGFGALLYASRYPDDLSGVVAMAPFLGQYELTEEIMSAGGLAHWIAGEVTADDHPRHLWRWLKTYQENPTRLPTLFLAYGEGDLFAPAQRLLAATLPPAHVLTVQGDHRWPTWQQLWNRFLCEPALFDDRRPAR